MSDQAREGQGRFGRLRAWVTGSARDGDSAADRCVRLRAKGRSRRGPLRLLVAALILLPLVGVAATMGWFYHRLAQGPIEITSFGGPLSAAFASRMGGGYAVELGPMAIEDSEHGPRIAISGFAMKGENGRTIVAAPQAEVSVNPLPLLFGSVSPRRLEVMDVEVRLSVLPDGAVAISAGSEPLVLTGGRAPDAAADAAPAPQTDAMTRLGEAVRTLLDSAVRSDSPAGALKRLGISRGRLVFDDRKTNQVTVFDDFELDLDKTDRSAALSLSARGPNGRWKLEAKTSGRPGEARDVDVQLTDITLDELLLVMGVRDPGFDFDMPLSSQLTIALDEEGKIVRAGGRFSAGAGFFFIDDRDAEPVQFDEVAGAFDWNKDSRRFDIGRTIFQAGQSRFVIVGAVTPPPKPGDAWRVEGRTIERAVFGPERPNQKPISVDRASLVANIAADGRRFSLEKLELVGPEVNFAADADVLVTEAGAQIRMKGAAGRMPALAVVRLWPSLVAAPVRGWFLRNLRDGVLEQGDIAFDFDPETIALLKQDKPPPDDKLRIAFTLSNAAINAMDGLPPLSGIEGAGTITGHTATFLANRGVMEVAQGQRLQLVEGSFSVPDERIRPTPAAINLRMSGPLDAVADLFDRDALKAYAQLPIDSTTVKGQIEGRMLIDMKLGDNVPPEDTSVRASATLTNFSVDKLVGKERLEGATLNVTAERGVLRAAGQGRMFGAPATIELRKASATQPTEAVIGMTLDDAARAKFGMNFGSSLTGPIGARMTAALGQKDKTRAQVEIDFTRAAIDNLLPGYTKASGRPAKASFTLVNDADGPDLENFVFDGGGAYAKGLIELSPSGAFEAAKFTQIRLSPGDDIKVDAEQTKDALKLTVRGASVDSRPFVKLLTTGAGPREAGASKDLDIDLKVNQIAGNNKQSASNVELRLVRRAGAIRQFQLSGRFGRDAVSGSMVRAPGAQAPQITLTSNDAGALLNFFDFYKRMEGGKLQLVAQIDDGVIEGAISVRDFIVRNEPALRRLVSEGVAARDRSGQIRIDTTAAAFTRMQVGFTRGQGRIELRDGVIYGPEAGTTVEGWIDTIYDRVNMTGTFVPAYGLNNFFSKIPLFGMILGGGANEGLFGVNFRISGPATAPVLTINPLSAIAPGFLRKIFGAGEVGTSQMPAAQPQNPALGKMQ